VFSPGSSVIVEFKVFHSKNGLKSSTDLLPCFAKPPSLSSRGRLTTDKIFKQFEQTVQLESIAPGLMNIFGRIRSIGFNSRK